MNGKFGIEDEMRSMRFDFTSYHEKESGNSKGFVLNSALGRDSKSGSWFTFNGDYKNCENPSQGKNNYVCIKSSLAVNFPNDFRELIQKTDKNGNVLRDIQNDLASQTFDIDLSPPIQKKTRYL